MPNQHSNKFFDEAYQYFPGGINVPLQSFKAVGGTPLYIQSLNGAYLTDVDGNRYLDLQGNWGSQILGHQHPEILQAIGHQIEKGYAFSAPHKLELELAKLIIDNIQGLEQIRFMNTQSEACAAAVRVAREATGRSKIVMFRGAYHGDVDMFQQAMGDAGITFGNPNVSGVPQTVLEDVLVADYNHIDEVEDYFRKYPEQIAGVLVEPVLTQMGCIVPENRFLEKLRKICHQYQSLLIFDETSTGFRLAYGGAQEMMDIQADLVIYGKIIGGGFPLSALAGKKEWMGKLVTKGRVYQSTELYNNALALASGIATLKHILKTPNFYKQLNQKTEFLDFELGKIFNHKNIRHRINRKGSILSVFFFKTSVNDYQSAKDSDAGLYNNLFHQMLGQGIYLPPSVYQSWYLSSAIREKELEQLLEAFRKFEYQ